MLADAHISSLRYLWGKMKSKLQSKQSRVPSYYFFLFFELIPIFSYFFLTKT